jgi:cyclase
MTFTRRRFLNTSLAAAPLLLGSAALPRPLLAATPASLDWQLLDRDGLALIEGAGGNVLVLAGPDGVALIDGGSVDSVGSVLATVEQQTGKLPSLLFNSHCHRDQIGCNAVLGAAGATIIAHENTRLWLTTEILSKWEQQVYPPLPASALPNKTFYYDSETIDFNGKLTYGYLPQAHTDGDIYVHLPERNLLFVGDVVSVGRYPLCDFSTNGWIGGMINSLNLLLTLCDDNTRVITSSGLTDKAHVQKQLELCSAVADKLGTALYQGSSLPEFLASKPTADFDAAWGNADLFLRTAWEGTLPHVTEIRRFGRRA